MALAVLSVLVVLGCGFGWVSLHRVGGANVITAAPAAASTTAGSGAQNILLVGLDTRTDAHGHPLPPDQLAALHAGSSSDGGDNTDTIIVVHIPAGGGAATAFSIPRDSYVTLAGDFGTHKINSAYTYGENTARTEFAAQGITGSALEVAAAEAGAREAIGTVQALTGLSITHYTAVNLAAFDAISNAVGGVQVCLAAPTQDDFSGADFPAGAQTITGAAALAFVRQRHGLPNGDLDRIRREQVFMAALSSKLLSAGILTNPIALGGILQAVDNDVVLDQHWDLLSFVEQLHGLSAGAVTFLTVPTGTTNLPTPEDGTAVAIDPAAVQTFIQNTINPPPPSDRTGPTAPAVSGRSASVDPDSSVDSVEGLEGSGQLGAPATGPSSRLAAFGPVPAEHAEIITAPVVSGPGIEPASDREPPAASWPITPAGDRRVGFASPANPAQDSPALQPPISADAIPCIN